MSGQPSSCSSPPSLTSLLLTESRTQPFALAFDGCIDVAGLIAVTASYLWPAEIWYRHEFEDWEQPASNQCTANQCLLHYAATGGVEEIPSIVWYGATCQDKALRIAAKSKQPLAARALLHAGAMAGGFEAGLLWALDRGGCGKLLLELSRIDGSDKLKNVMLYFRWMWANDEDFRWSYLTKDIRETLDTDEYLAGKEGVATRRLAEGSVVWRRCLTSEQKRALRQEFKAWVTDHLLEEAWSAERLKNYEAKGVE
jgi:hypothetical protein